MLLPVFMWKAVHSDTSPGITAETTANGLTVINEKTTFTTWFKADFAAADILTIGGVDFEIVGHPENVEMRSRYSVLTLERISGGA